MIGKRYIIAGIACLMAAGSAYASGVVAPADVAFEDGAVAVSVSGTAGDPVEGRKAFADRKLGNCLACHAVTDLNDQLFHGEVGPPLDGAADRWSEAELRGIVVNSKSMFSEDTVMPGFYTLEVGKNVRKDLIGQTILSAQQVEDIVAYLATLKE